MENEEGILDDFIPFGQPLPMPPASEGSKLAALAAPAAPAAPPAHTGGSDGSGGSGSSRPAARTAAGATHSVLRFGVPWLDATAYTRYCQRTGLTRKKPTRLPAHPTALLNVEVAAFAEYVSPTPAERAARLGAIGRLLTTLESIYGPLDAISPGAGRDLRADLDALAAASGSPAPAAPAPRAGQERKPTLYIFGSFDSDLFLPGSDIDAVLVLYETRAGAKDDLRHVGEKEMHTLARTLVRTGAASDADIQVIAQARVPIVKYKDARTAFEVDVAFQTRTGVDAALFLRRAMREQPALRPLALLLKCVLRMRGLNTVYTGGLGSFALLCMLLAFLQAHPLLQTRAIRAEDNLGILLLDFLDLHGRNFSYESVGIAFDERDDDSDAAGSGSGDDAGRRSPFESLAREYAYRYFEKGARRGWTNDARPGQLAIEDPQEPTNDIARGSFAFNSVRLALEHCHSILRSAMREYVECARSRPSVLVLGRTAAAASETQMLPSILGSIVALDDQLLMHRFYIQHARPNRP